MTGGEQLRAHDSSCDDAEQLPTAVLKAALTQRAQMMFSGATGAVVASGEGQATSTPSHQLVKDTIEVVGGLPPELFDQWAEQRPCGLLDTYDAVGMIICDVLGLRIIPWILAKPIGKAAAKLPAQVSGEMKKAKKAAARKGENVEEAAAGVLCRAVRLPIPSVVEIAKAWQELSKAAAKPPAADPPEPKPLAANPPVPPVLHAPPAPIPTASATDPTATAATAPADTNMKRLHGSREAAYAIMSAGEIEDYRASLEEELATGPSPPSSCDHWDYANYEAYLRAKLKESEVEYAARMCALKEAFPRVVCSVMRLNLACAYMESPVSARGSRLLSRGLHMSPVVRFVIATWRPADSGLWVTLNVGSRSVELEGP